MDLVCRYSPDEYPRYENYNAIEVGKLQTFHLIIPELWAYLLLFG